MNGFVKSLLLAAVLSPFLVLGNVSYQVNIYDSEWEEKPAGDCLLILGSRVMKDGEPGLMMKERLAMAQEIVEENRRIIVSGGKIDQDYSEAEVMKKELSEWNPELDILTEEKSTSTYQNLLYSKPLIKEHCKKLDILSHDFHLSRIKLTAKRLEIPINRLIGVESDSIHNQQRVIREHTAYLWYWLGWSWIHEEN